jgi:hypothetical protein
MQSKGWIFFFLPALVYFSAGCGSPSGSSDWAAAVEVADGVRVVRNPQTPRYGEVELDWALGGEEDENTRFFRVRAIALDNRGNLYVADAGNHRVQQFDGEGRYKRTFGRKGDGPGEFDFPSRLYVDSRGHVFVNQYKRLQEFDASGEFISSVAPEINISSFVVDGDGRVIGCADLRSRDPAVRGIVKLDAGGKVSDTFAEYHDSGIRILTTGTRTITISPNHAYSPRLLFTGLGGGIYVYGYAGEYELFLIDGTGTAGVRLSKSEAPVPIGREEKAVILDRTVEAVKRSRLEVPRKKVEEIVRFAEFRARFDKLLSDDLRRLYVQKVRSVLREDEDYLFDVFNDEGYYLYKFRLPFSPEKIRGGYLYDVHVSPDSGITEIRRYRVTNWEELKRDI